jgi:hypothetical protein
LSEQEVSRLSELWGSVRSDTEGDVYGDAVYEVHEERVKERIYNARLAGLLFIFLGLGNWGTR